MTPLTLKTTRHCKGGEDRDRGVGKGEGWAPCLRGGRLEDQKRGGIEGGGKSRKGT